MATLTLFIISSNHVCEPGYHKAVSPHSNSSIEFHNFNRRNFLKHSFGAKNARKMPRLSGLHVNGSTGVTFHKTFSTRTFVRSARPTALFTTHPGGGSFHLGPKRSSNDVLQERRFVGTRHRRGLHVLEPRVDREQWRGRSADEMVTALIVHLARDAEVLERASGD